MATIIEKRIVNEYIDCALGLGTARLFVPIGLFDRTWYMKDGDGTIMECRVIEIGWCKVDDGGKQERRNYVKYKSPYGIYTNFNRCGGFYLYHSYDDAVRSANAVRPYISRENEPGYVTIDVAGLFVANGFDKNGFEAKGTWYDCLHVYGYKYVNGNIIKVAIKSTLWYDKDGFHIEPIIPDGVYKTKEEAYAANMPKLITFDDEEDEEELTPEQKRIAELEEIIRKAQEELSKINK